MRYTTPTHIHTALVEQIGYLTTPVTRESYHRYLNRRATAALEAADTASSLAEQLLRSDPDNAARLLQEARDFFAEFRHIDSMRVKPVLD